MKMDDTLSKTFGIKPMETEVISADVEIETKTIGTSRIDADYDVSRDNLHSLLQQGKEALEHALAVAKQSEHPRAFEVVGQLIKQLADVNQQLMDVHQQKKKLEEPSKASKTETTNNNAIFVGSTAELSKMISDMTKGDK